jgi:hypothetical protein
MRTLQNKEVMAVAGGMIECEPGLDVNPVFIESGGCVDNFLDYMFWEIARLFEWNYC